MRRASDNFSGFTKQTETLLCGVGANKLIKECKKRNISTDVLHKLTKEDFVQLGNAFIFIFIMLFYFYLHILYALFADIFLDIFVTRVYNI